MKSPPTRTRLCLFGFFFHLKLCESNVEQMQMSTDGQMIYPFIKCGISTIVKYYSALKRKEKGRRMGQATACVDPEGIMLSGQMRREEWWLSEAGGGEKGSECLMGVQLSEKAKSSTRW